MHYEKKNQKLYELYDNWAVTDIHLFTSLNPLNDVSQEFT